MQRATISQLKNRLSSYLKKVRSGEVILVLDRDEPVARLEPIGLGERPGDRLTRLQRQGLVRGASRPLPLELLRSDPPVSGKSVLGALLEEREESA